MEPFPDNARVNSCAGERACVRIAHLSVAIPDDRTGKRTGRRRPRRTGSKREVRPDVWQLAITEATTTHGPPVRHFETIHGGESAADIALAELAGTVRRDLGDLRVHELVGRYLHANHEPASTALERDLALYRGVPDRHFRHAWGGARGAVGLGTRECSLTCPITHRRDP